jgi:hypothetical protein
VPQRGPEAGCPSNIQFKNFSPIGCETDQFRCVIDREKFWANDPDYAHPQEWLILKRTARRRIETEPLDILMTLGELKKLAIILLLWK